MRFYKIIKTKRVFGVMSYYYNPQFKIVWSANYFSLGSKQQTCNKEIMRELVENSKYCNKEKEI